MIARPSLPACRSTGLHTGRDVHERVRLLRQPCTVGLLPAEHRRGATPGAAVGRTSPAGAPRPRRPDPPDPAAAPRDNEAYRFPVSVKGVVLVRGRVVLLR